MKFCAGKGPNYVCKVCGGPINRPGVHDACKDEGSGKRSTSPMTIALSKLEREVKSRPVEVRRWTPDMGEDVLLEMFPDMADRIRGGRS